ncbi:glutamate--tRNA ligase [Flavobacterium salilacus subsp. salilacus]|uniref:glutamate--tRNA ligase n=1 Tax=Flavobacterium TaxID=237 RepID=UPI001075070C|nr:MULTISPECIES: glutamate--tRNA ligase [Flavobacterium]KAF2519019.1 glutamate--tRNA ligase [Flavobacterium salilacus subsp. salilacus]MBE1614818.1 glutamate--tRNA ligase [Flavobacterium sp. SaA2.13]
MSRPVRVRFAPSPTGPLHIGGVRTALFNYLFAKKHNGVFYLRIEDTDQNRYVAGAEDYIVEALNWCGIPFDEGVGKEGKYGPYRQSERKDIYKQYAQQLIDSGWAYYAFDTADSLDTARKEAESNGETFIYNHTNREMLDNSLRLAAEETQQRIANGEEYVIRFKTPTDETLSLKDIIRGDVKFETNLLDDKVLFKSDGMPTYHLANIVDDYLMETSHVIRGEEWLPSLPLHVLLYRAFGWEAPEFAHLPLILKPVGNGKLSKRDGDKFGFPVFPLQWNNEDGTSSMGYREEGYLPQAVVNYLALLGWSPGNDQEFFSIDELVRLFELEKVHKAGAKFDPAKIKSINHHYFQLEDNAVLAKQFSHTLLEKGINKPIEAITKILGMVKERATFAGELWELSKYFFETPESYDEKAAKKQWKEDTGAILTELTTVIEGIYDFSSENIETITKAWMEEKGLGFKMMPPLRLSLVGEMKGAHMFDIMELIGKEETVNRINKAVTTLS